MIAARGTSDNAARYAQYLFGARLGLPVALAAPSLTTMYGAPAVPRGATRWSMAISQSGPSPDVVGVLESARAAGVPTLADHERRRLAAGRAADAVLELGVGPERSVAATKTYTASLAVVAALVARLRDDAAAAAALGASPALVPARDRCRVRGRRRARRPTPPRRTSSSSAAASTTRRRWRSRSSCASSPPPSPRASRRPTSCTGRSPRSARHACARRRAPGKARASVLEAAAALRDAARADLIADAADADLRLPPASRSGSARSSPSSRARCSPCAGRVIGRIDRRAPWADEGHYDVLSGGRTERVAARHGNDHLSAKSGQGQLRVAGLEAAPHRGPDLALRLPATPPTTTGTEFGSRGWRERSSADERASPLGVADARLGRWVSRK